MARGIPQGRKKVKIDPVAVDTSRNACNFIQVVEETRGRPNPGLRELIARQGPLTTCPGREQLLSNINPLNAYKETKIRTASQGQLIIMIYDEAIKQIDIASSGLEEGTRQLDIVHNAIVKAQDLVTELTVSLDFERGGEIAKGLFSLYMFFREQLLVANVKKSPTILESIRAMLAELREAWIQICKSGVEFERAAPSGVNLAG